MTGPGSSPSTDPRQDDAEQDGRWVFTIVVSGLYPIGAQVLERELIDWTSNEWGCYGPVVSLTSFREARS